MQEKGNPVLQNSHVGRPGLAVPHKWNDWPYKTNTSWNYKCTHWPIARAGWCFIIKDYLLCDKCTKKSFPFPLTLSAVPACFVPPVVSKCNNNWARLARVTWDVQGFVCKKDKVQFNIFWGEKNSPSIHLHHAVVSFCHIRNGAHVHWPCISSLITWCGGKDTLGFISSK